MTIPRVINGANCLIDLSAVTVSVMYMDAGH